MGNVLSPLRNTTANALAILIDIYEYNVYGFFKPLFYTRLCPIFITTKNIGIAKWEPYSDMIGSVHITGFEDLTKILLFIYPFDSRTNLITNGLLYKEKIPGSETKFWIYDRNPETEEIVEIKIPSPIDIDEVIRVFNDSEEF